MKKMFRLIIIAPENAVNQCLAILCGNIYSGWEEQQLADGKMRYTVYAEKKEYLQNFAMQLEGMDFAIQTIIDTVNIADPLEGWKEFFTPVSCGTRFIIVPPWLANDNFENPVKIIIEPKTAFGTGHHASTVLCLAALSRLLDYGLVKQGGRFLDLGCGTGILGIAAALSGLFGICLDIDPQAIDNAIENRLINNVMNLEIAEGSLEKTQNQKFDLVMANILARPLIEMAKTITGILAKNSCLILSGILVSQSKDVEKAFCSCGLPPAEKIASDDWTALIWSNLQG